VAHLGSAIVGARFIGPVHVEALRRLGRSVVGVQGSAPEKSRQTARALNIPKAYARYEDLWADPAVNVVPLASPNRLRFEQCRLAKRKGVPAGVTPPPGAVVGTDGGRMQIRDRTAQAATAATPAVTAGVPPANPTAVEPAAATVAPPVTCADLAAPADATAVPRGSYAVQGYDSLTQEPFKFGSKRCLLLATRR
jgi:Oxidoreductase family, NAD-binding Rossmann fold